MVEFGDSDTTAGLQGRKTWAVVGLGMCFYLGPAVIQICPPTVPKVLK